MKAETRIKIAKRVTIGVCAFLVCICLWLAVMIRGLYDPAEAFFLILFLSLFHIILITIYLTLAWPVRHRKKKQTSVSGVLYILCMIVAFVWFPHVVETVVIVAFVLLLQGISGLLGLENTLPPANLSANKIRTMKILAVILNISCLIFILVWVILKPVGYWPFMVPIILAPAMSLIALFSCKSLIMVLAIIGNVSLLGLDFLIFATMKSKPIDVKTIEVIFFAIHIAVPLVNLIVLFNHYKNKRKIDSLKESTESDKVQ